MLTLPLNRDVTHMLSDMFQDNCKASLYPKFDYGLLRLPDVDYWLKAGVTRQQGMLTPPRHLIPLLVYPGVLVCHAHFLFVFFYYEIDYGSLYFPFHVEMIITG